MTCPCSRLRLLDAALLPGHSSASASSQAPSFLTVHMGVDRSALPEGCFCHHILLEDWDKMYDPLGTLFLSIPSTLDPSVAPEGKHLVHAFTPDWIDNW